MDTNNNFKLKYWFIHTCLLSTNFTVPIVTVYNYTPLCMSNNIIVLVPAVLDNNYAAYILFINCSNSCTLSTNNCNSESVYPFPPM